MIYAIDVDGVIIDSRNQVIIDAFNAYREFFKDTLLFGNTKFTLANYREVFKRYPETYSLFQDMQVFSKSQQELVFLFYLIDHKINISNDKEFRAKLAAIRKSTLKEWNDEFYRQRYLFQEQGNWAEVIKHYPEVIGFIKKEIKRVVILSNKDTRTIKAAFKAAELTIPDEKIFGKEMGNEKNEKIGMICRKFNLSHKDVHFIDDNFVNLKDAQTLGVNCYMATWGVNSKDQQKEAEKIGIKLLKIADLEKL